MAYKRRRMNKKKVYKKKSSGGPGYKTVHVTKSIRTGFPPIMTMKHSYNETVQLTYSGVAPIGDYEWSCNGMTDPYFSGGGHKPYYFSEMINVYNHYTVIGSKIKCTFTPITTTEEAIAICLTINDDNTTVPTSFQTLREMGKSKFLNISADSNNNHFLTNGWSAKKAFGAQGTLANSLLRGSASANPAEFQNFAIYIQALGTASAVSIYCTVDIEYIAVWNELKDVVGS